MDNKNQVEFPPLILLAVTSLILMMPMASCTNQNQTNLQIQVRTLSTSVRDLRATLAFVSTVQAFQSTQIGLAQAEQAEGGAVATTAAPQPSGITVTPSLTALTTVYGSIEIEDGICCAGGQAGDMIQLNVTFEAASTAGDVVEMRFATALGQADEVRMSQEAWVPFQSEKLFTSQLAINWVGWWISVQYRDDQGNISPIYFDDISLEGN